MSKILRRCLSIVLVLMLLASLSLNGSILASADNKTGNGLAAYAMRAYNEGWVYSWGGASPGAVDCSGLIYSYVGSGARTTEDMLSSSTESGYISNGIPNIPGLGLWQPGHVGVYVGGGMAVDARDEISNVCYQSVTTKSWVMWFKVNGISYDTDSSVTNDNQSYDDTDSSDTQNDSESSVLSNGSIGFEVQELQERLKMLGYFEEDTTQYFGDVTETALIEFQTAAGLNPDGVYNETTKNVLLSDNAPEKNVSDNDIETDLADSEETVNIPTIDGENIDPDLENESDNSEALTSTDSQRYVTESYTVSEEENIDGLTDTYKNTENTDQTEAVYKGGDTGDEISNIQYMLIKLDYYHYNITGVFDEKTANAVEFFQLDNNLNATGSVDSDTLSAIFSKYNSKLSESNDDVLKKFDEATENAVIKAQKAFGSEESGVVSDKLFNSLSEDSVSDTYSDSSDTETVETAKVNTVSDTADVGSLTDNGKASSANKDDTATENKSAVQKKSPKTGDPYVMFIKKIVDKYVNKTLVLVVIAVTLIIIFFAGTVHYWNISMEKRRQRARKATTVSVYRRGSM